MPEIGQTILHYRIVEMIGGGGMEEIYKAKDQRLGKMERSYPVLVTAILCLFLGTLQSEKSFAKDTEITPGKFCHTVLWSAGGRTLGRYFVSCLALAGCSGKATQTQIQEEKN